MNRFAWLIRREFWEHRAIWIAPAVVLALLLIGAVTGNAFIGDVHVNADVALGDGDAAHAPAGVAPQPGPGADAIAGHPAAPEPPAAAQEAGRHGRLVGAGELISTMPVEKRQALLVVVYAAVAALMFLVLGTIGFFYSLDALYADRRDRSVLFWKSLPLSDTETVLSKFVMAAAVIPAVAAVAAFAAQLITATGASVKLALVGGDWTVMWMPQAIGASALAAAAMACICALWFAPVTAYLLLASSWAPRSPFLWAVLPPIALSMVEKIAFGSAYIGGFLKYRMLAPFQALFAQQNMGSAKSMSVDLAGGVMNLMVSPGMWLGLVGAALLFVATVWVRRYRDETI